MKRDYSIIKTVLFSVGLVLIIALAIALFPLGFVLTWKYVFIVFDILLIYCALFLPLVLTHFVRADAAKITIGGIIYYRGAITFCSMTFFIAMFMLRSNSKPTIYVILQCAAVLAVAIYFFIACFTADHIDSVSDKERGKIATIEDLRVKSNNLAIRAESLGDEYNEIKEMAKQLSDNMRYLSPSSSVNAAELERKIGAYMDTIENNICFLSNGTVSSESILSQFRELDTVYKQRKAML